MNKNFSVSTAGFLCALTVTAAAVLTACGGGDSSTAAVDDGPPPAVERSISAATIDPKATKATDPHFTINPSPSVTAVNKLFVFLPGTQGVPSLYEFIVRQASASGYHAIGLNYVNEVPVGVLCADSSDARCFWNVRREIILGQDLTNLVDVDPPNSIVTRLSNAIAYLNKNYPAEGWGQYLKSDGTTDWSKVVIGGHSQGGGHAGVMTKLFSMSRACYFSSPPDYDTAPAEWMSSQANITPASLQFGFAGLSDPSVPYDQLSQNFQAMGLAAFGSAVSVDTGSPPYNGSHILTTNAAPDTSSSDQGTPLHGLTVRDAFTPLTTSKQPVFAPAWGYLCFN